MAAAKRRRKRKKGRNRSGIDRRQRFDSIMIIVAFFISLAAFVSLAFIYWNQDTGIGDEQLELMLTGDKMNISWEDTEAVDFIRLYRENPITEELEAVGEFSDSRATLDGIKSGEELTLKFEPVRVKTLWNYSLEIKSRKKSVTIIPRELTVPDLSDDIDIESGIVTLNIPMDENCVCEIYNPEDDAEPFISTQEAKVNLTVGDNIEMPERGTPLRFYARTYLQEKNCKQYSVTGDVLEITREELLPNKVSIAHGISMDANYSFSWGEAKPDTYEFLQYNDETASWDILKTYNASDELKYQIDWLPSEKVMSYKVRAYFSNPQSDLEREIIESSELSIRSDRTALYCTIWPVQNLDLYATATANEVVGGVKAGETLCVLEEAEGRFRVRTGDGYGYIDSRYCMINLPDFLGDLCRYDITNSYSSLFKVQKYTIPGMTGYTLPGYENICISRDEGEFVVPFLYPCACRLALAAEKVSEDNYVLKIYEAFRPHEATRYMYDTTELVLPMQTPVVDSDGNPVGMNLDDEGRLILSDTVGNNYENVNAMTVLEEDAPVNEQAYLLAAQQATAEGFDITTPEGKSRIVQLTPALTLNLQSRLILMQQGLDPDSAEQELQLQSMLLQPTYEAAMTGGGSFRLSAFLAKAVSAHNRGIALDLTLEDRETGNELEMQSAIHDLSFQSILAKNNDNAAKLRDYMIEVGFSDLSSEWWHFQDDLTRNEIGLGACLENGVTLKGWKGNNVGWRYQLDNGDFYRNTTETIDGTEYTFNEKGYCENFE